VRRSDRIGPEGEEYRVHIASVVRKLSLCSHLIAAVSYVFEDGFKRVFLSLRDHEIVGVLIVISAWIWGSVAEGLFPQFDY
jgi:hypothetical protein